VWDLVALCCDISEVLALAATSLGIGYDLPLQLSIFNLFCLYLAKTCEEMKALYNFMAHLRKNNGTKLISHGVLLVILECPKL